MKADMFLCMGKCNTALSIEHEIMVHVNQRETQFLIAVCESIKLKSYSRPSVL